MGMYDSHDGSRLDEFTTGFDRGEDPKKMEKKSLGPQMQLGEVVGVQGGKFAKKKSKNPLNMIVEEIQIDVRLFFFLGGGLFSFHAIQRIECGCWLEEEKEGWQRSHGKYLWMAR